MAAFDSMGETLSRTFSEGRAFPRTELPVPGDGRDAPEWSRCEEMCESDTAGTGETSAMEPVAGCVIFGRFEFDAGASGADVPDASGFRFLRKRFLRTTLRFTGAATTARAPVGFTGRRTLEVGALPGVCCDEVTAISDCTKLVSCERLAEGRGTDEQRDDE